MIIHRKLQLSLKKSRPALEYRKGIRFLIVNKYEEAEKWLIKAAKKGFKKAYSKLIDLYISKGENDKACFWLVKNKGNNDSKNLYNLSIILDPQNSEEARSYLVRSAKLGYIPAQELLYLINDGEGSQEEANKWFVAAAEQGHIICKYKYGTYLEQEGKELEAIKYYKEAAENGDTSGLFNIGNIYMDKYNLTNINSGLDYFPQNDNEEPDMSFLLGLMALHFDIDEAKYWFKFSADNGNKTSKIVLIHLGKHSGEISNIKKWLALCFSTGI
jgi:TPR repeat protein